MKKLTFKKQIIIGLLFYLLMLICSTVFYNGIFSSVGLIVYGLLFVINPVCPEKTESVKNIHLWMRLAGIIVVINAVVKYIQVKRKINSSIGIIGGADGPTKIFISGNPLPGIIAVAVMAAIIVGIVIILKKRK